MTSLIVISSEYDTVQEACLVNALFSEGMQLFHLRKPFWDKKDQRSFLEKIDPGFHSMISVHQHHETVTEFGLKYLHVKEADRKNGIVNNSLKLSTSFHSYNELSNEKANWNHCFLSPVFDSISKTNYQSGFNSALAIDKGIKQKVFALGGVNKNNIDLVFEKGFYGAAVLGAIWQDPLRAIRNFKEINALCKQNVHSF